VAKGPRFLLIGTGSPRRPLMLAPVKPAKEPR
jgi:hypothetical protein